MFVLFVVFRHAVIDRCSFFFFFKQKTAYEMRISDWSSDVCSSDLPLTASRISTQPPSDPGTAPRTRIRPRSTSVDTTIRFWVVTRTSPMWPALFLPFHTRPGSWVLPVHPWLPFDSHTPCCAPTPPNFRRFLAPAQPPPIKVPVTLLYRPHTQT